MKDIGKDAGAVRAKYQLICPECGKPAVRRENGPGGVAYLHLTKRGSVRHYIGAESGKRKREKPIPQSAHGADSSLSQREPSAGGKGSGRRA